MNGRLARRIHRAALHVLLVGPGMAPSKGSTVRQIVKTLKREYRARPYHKRNPTGCGYVSLTHRQQERRWWRAQPTGRGWQGDPKKFWPWPTKGT